MLLYYIDEHSITFFGEEDNYIYINYVYADNKIENVHEVWNRSVFESQWTTFLFFKAQYTWSDHWSHKSQQPLKCDVWWGKYDLVFPLSLCVWIQHVLLHALDKRHLTSDICVSVVGCSVPLWRPSYTTRPSRHDMCGYDKSMLNWMELWRQTAGYGSNTDRGTIIRYQILQTDIKQWVVLSNVQRWK